MAQYPAIYEHMLQTLKGWFDMTSLDKSAPFDADLLEDMSLWPVGRVGYLTAAGEIALADNATLAGNEMPLYLWQCPTSLDVGAMSGTTMRWANAMPAGVITGLVATGGYELQTTEFDTEASYPPNTFLTAVADDDGVGGLLSPVTFGSYNFDSWICGIASLHCQQRWDDPNTKPTLATGENAYKQEVLSFWTYFLPKVAGA